MKNGRKVATQKIKIIMIEKQMVQTIPLGIKIPTNKLFEKSGTGNIKKPPINPIIIET